MKETYWKYIADNKMIDEKGVLNRDLRGVDHGIASLNKSLAPEKTVRFDPKSATLPQIQSHIRSEVAKSKAAGANALRATAYTSTATLSKPPSAGQQANPSTYTKASKTSAINLPSHLDINGAKKTDDYFSEKELNAQISALKLQKMMPSKEVTIPKGPSMLKRDKKESTVEKKTKEYYDKKKQQDEEEHLKQFQAQEVPMSSKTPMFDNIVRAERERMIKNKTMSKEKTEAMQKPFSFYEEDKAKVEKKKEIAKEPPLIGQDFVFNYKAKELPTFYAQADSVKVQQHEQIEKKKQQKEEHKQKLIAESKLPPRLEEHKNNKKETIREKKVSEMVQEARKRETFAPAINKDVPNFKQLQDQFSEELKHKKESRPKTEALPFDFEAREKEKEQKLAEERAKAREAEKKSKEEKEKELQWKAENINTFLNRNYLPTEKKKEEAKQQLDERMKAKMNELRQQSKFKNATDEELLRQIKVSDNERRRIVTTIAFEAMRIAGVEGYGDAGGAKNIWENLHFPAEAPVAAPEDKPADGWVGQGGVVDAPGGQPLTDGDHPQPDDGMDDLNNKLGAEQNNNDVQDDFHNLENGEAGDNQGEDGQGEFGHFEELPAENTGDEQKDEGQEEQLPDFNVMDDEHKGDNNQDNQGFEEEKVEGDQALPPGPLKAIVNSPPEQLPPESAIPTVEKRLTQPTASPSQNQPIVNSLPSNPTGAVGPSSGQPSRPVNSTPASIVPQPSTTNPRQPVPTKPQQPSQPATQPSAEVAPPPPNPQPPQQPMKVLFTVDDIKKNKEKDTSVAHKEIDPFRKTRRDLEIQRDKEEKERQAKKLAEEKKREEEARKQKHEEARQKVAEKLAIVDPDKQRIDQKLEEDRLQRIKQLKEADEQYKIIQQQIEQTAKDKACLVEEKCHMSKVLSEYRRKMQEKGIKSTKSSHVSNIGSPN